MEHSSGEHSSDGDFDAVSLMSSSQMSSMKLYVSPTGNESNSGEIDSPFATLQQARDAIRQIKNSTGLPDQGIAILLREGTYPLTNTFQLEAIDSGSEGKPITYTSFPGEQARITGGQSIDSQLFSPVTNELPLWNFLDVQARPNILYTDLNDHGITDYGTLSQRNVFSDQQSALQLYFDDQPMTLARWPDKAPETSPFGLSDVARSAQNGFTLIDHASSDTSFTYEGNRPERWTSASDAWLHGFFKYDWADFHVPVNDLNTSTKTITIPSTAYGTASGQHYYAYNLVEEITQPGEWYLDRNDGKLYFWPPSDIHQADLTVSTLNTNAIELQNASWIVLQDLVIEGGRNKLVTIQGGSNNLVESSTLRNAGSWGIEISGTNSSIQNSEVSYTGDGAIRVSGGNRVDLSPGNNLVSNNDIHHFGQWVYGYKPGIKVEGVGQHIANNELHQGPHVALQWEGNDHVLEYNDLHDVTRFATDMGAMYSGRDWGWRGNVIRHNFLHDVASWIVIPSGWPFKVHGVYLDDNLSGTTVFGNHFYRIDGYGVLNGGGRENLIENNLFSYTGVPLFSDNRGVLAINFTPGSSYNLLERIANDGIDYQAEPWASAYPELAVIPNTFGTQDATVPWLHPEGTTYSRNLSYNTWHPSPTDIFDTDLTPHLPSPPGIPYKPSDSFAEVIDNVRLQDPLFVNEATLDLNLQPGSPALAIPGFVDIPFDLIGRFEVVEDNADFDNDGDVDGSDFLIWQRGYGTDAGNGNIAPQTEGNANNDSLVNGNDLTIWQTQFGQSSGSALALAESASVSAWRSYSSNDAIESRELFVTAEEDLFDFQFPSGTLPLATLHSPSYESSPPLLNTTNTCDADVDENFHRIGKALTPYCDFMESDWTRS